MKKLIILTAIILLCASCQKDDNGNWFTYYKTIGEGYFYDGDNNTPLKDVTIFVDNCLDEFDGMSAERATESFTTDENGYFQIRFMKKYSGEKVVRYRFDYTTLASHFWHDPSDILHQMYPDDLKGEKTFSFDTIKLYRVLLIK